MSLDYWFMFPISVLIATIAMASGVEGATFYTPFFMLGLGLPTEVAIGTGLFTEVFGFSSGLFAYGRKGLIDYQLGRNYLQFTIPLALLGTWASNDIPEEVLKVLLGVGLFAIALSFLRPPTPAWIKQEAALAKQDQPEDEKTCLTTREGEVFRYSHPSPAEGRLLSGIGAMFLGLVSTGLGEMNGYVLMQRSKMPGKVAVATSVFIVAITALTASVGRAVHFAQIGGDTLATVLSLMLFTAPGVLIGAQLGALVANYLPQHQLERGMGVLFLMVSVFVLGEIGLSHQFLAGYY